MTDTQKLRALLDAATARPWGADVWYGNDDGGWAAIGPHCKASEADDFDDVPESPSYDQAMADAALIAAAVNALPELLDEVEAAGRRSANQVELIDTLTRRAEEAEAQACEAQAVVQRVGDYIEEWADAGFIVVDHDDEPMPSIRRVATGMNAGRALLDRLRTTEAERDALQAEMARLRSDLDIELEQSAKFVKEIELLKAGIADAERWAAQSTASEAVALGVIKRAALDMLRIPVSIEALAVSAIRQNLSDFRPSMAGSRMLDRLRAIETERDALRAEVERLRARKTRFCDSCLGLGLARLDGSKEPCPACGGSGAVIVEGDEK